MDLTAFPSVELNRQDDWPSVLAFVRDYWQAKRGSRAMPARNDVSPAQLKTQLPHILIADVVEGGADFRYRLVGTQLRGFFQSEPSGKLMSEIIAPFGDRTLEATLEAYRAVVAKRAPVRLTGAGTWFGQKTKFFDAYLAPLSDDGAVPNMVLGTFVFEWDRDMQFQPLLSAWSA
ncbi:MAG TPA: PAS domain-containing protein [Rhizomicrobium sp.]|nr:PAS domain-containing protein [Rhizomicrobium sp.]